MASCPCGCRTGHKRGQDGQQRWQALPTIRDPLLEAVDLRGAHDFRHTFATWLEDAGIPARVIDELMGHEATSRGGQQRGSAMGAHYRHTTPKMATRAVDAIQHACRSHSTWPTRLLRIARTGPNSECFSSRPRAVCRATAGQCLRAALRLGRVWVESDRFTGLRSCVSASWKAQVSSLFSSAAPRIQGRPVRWRSPKYRRSHGVAIPPVRLRLNLRMQVDQV
jgi:hypothetical protein